MIVVAFVVLTVIMIFVIPAFKDVFKSFGADLPAPTLFVIALSEFFVTYWWAIFGFIGLGGYFFLESWKRSEKMQKTMDRLLLKVPVFGHLVNKSAVARWTRTLSTMFAAGVPLVEALDSVGGASGNAVFAEATEQIQKDVSTGIVAHLLDAEHRACFPNMVLQMCAIGEESGSIDHMLAKAAEFYEDEVDEAVKGPVQPDGAVHHRHSGRADRRHRRVDVPADLQAWRCRVIGRMGSNCLKSCFLRSALALLGLCIGSFLNVVVHRLPLMLERGWKLESADLLGVKVDVPAADQLGASRVRAVRPAGTDRLAREHSAPRLYASCAAAVLHARRRYRRATR